MWTALCGGEMHQAFEHCLYPIWVALTDNRRQADSLVSFILLFWSTKVILKTSGVG